MLIINSRGWMEEGHNLYLLPFNFRVEDLAMQRGDRSYFPLESIAIHNINHGEAAQSSNDLWLHKFDLLIEEGCIKLDLSWLWISIFRRAVLHNIGDVNF